MKNALMIIWSYAVPLLLSICIAHSVHKLLKIRADIAYPVGYMFFGLGTYVFVLSGITITTSYILFFTILVFTDIVFAVQGKISYRFERKDIEIAIAFIVLYSFIFLFDYNRGFTHWDEMSHWGPMVKENLRLNQLYSTAESKLQAHKDYPPMIALFETAWCRVCGGYSEKYIYRSLHMLIASMIFPMVTNFTAYKKCVSMWICRILTVIPFIGVCTVLSLDDGNMLTTIYADGVLAVTAAFCIFLILTLRDYKKTEEAILIIAFSFLLLVKQIGFEYFCLCYLLLLLIGIQDYLTGTDRKCIVRRWGILLAIPAVFRVSWNIYVKVNQISGQFVTSKFDIDIFKAVITKADTASWQYQGTLGYFNALLLKPLFMLGGHSISYSDLVIICFVAYLMLFFLQKRVRKNYYVLPMFIVFVVSAFGHAMMMWISYMFMYCESDFLKLACYERYMNVIWIFNGIALLFLYLQLFWELLHEKWFILFLGAIAGICVTAIYLSDTGEFLKPALQNTSSLKEYYEEADFISDNTDEDSSIFIVTQSYTGWFEYVFQYLTMPRSYNDQYYSLGKPYSEEDNWTRDISTEKFLNIIGNYDYMYFYHVDEQFIEEYGMAIDNAEDIVFKNGNLYRIEHHDDGGVSLSLTGTY